MDGPDGPFALYSEAAAAPLDLTQPFEFMSTNVTTYDGEICIEGVARWGGMTEAVSTYVRVPDATMHFYVKAAPGATAEDVLAAYGGRATDVTVEQHRSIYGFCDKPSDFMRVQLRDPHDAGRMRSMKLRQVEATYEGKLQFTQRFTVDHGITGAGWVEVAANSAAVPAARVSRARVELIAPSAAVRGIPGRMETLPMRAICMDIETTARSGFPNAFADGQVGSITGVLQHLPSHTPLGAVVFSLGDSAPVPGAAVFTFVSERELLLGYAAFLRTYAYVFHAGWNSINFDMKFLLDRASVLGIYDQFATLTMRLGEVVRVRLKKLETGQLGLMKYYLALTGIPWDVLLFARRDTSYSPSSYKLNDVGKDLTGSCKVDMAYSAITTLIHGGEWTDVPREGATGAFYAAMSSMAHGVRDGRFFLSDGEHEHSLEDLAPLGEAWEHIARDCAPREVAPGHVVWDATPASRAAVHRYCLQDAQLPMDIMRVCAYTTNYIELARLTGVSLLELITGGQSVRTLTLILAYIRHTGARRLIPDYDAPAERKNSRVKGFEGAIVLYPQRGVFLDPVVTVDFASLYPSIMMTHNLCYTTHCPPEDVARMRADGYVVRETLINAASNQRTYFVQYRVLQPEDHAAIAALGIELDADGWTASSPALAALCARGYGLVEQGARTRVVLSIRGILPEMLVALMAARARAKDNMGPAQDRVRHLKLVKRLKAGETPAPDAAVTEAHLAAARADVGLASEEIARETVEQQQIVDAYNGQQLALKVVMNSVYGFTGAEFGKLPMLQISATVTAIGREMIGRVRAMIQRRGPTGRYCCDPDSENEEYRLGVCLFVAFVIYGDTDSLFALLRGETDILRAWTVGKHIARMATEMFARDVYDTPYPVHIKLALEKVIVRMLLGGKKKYMIMKVEQDQRGNFVWKIDSKGYEDVRRDTPVFLRELMKAVKGLLLPRDGPPRRDEAYALVCKTISDILQRKLPLHMFAITKSLNGKRYVGEEPAHVKLARRMGAFQVGTRVRFVFVRCELGPLRFNKKNERITQKYDQERMIQDVEIGERNGDVPNAEYYINTYIVRPLARIFALFELPSFTADTQERLQWMYDNQQDFGALKAAVESRMLNGEHTRKVVL